MSNSKKRGDPGSGSEDEDKSSRKRPAPQRLLYQPHEFETALELLLKHMPTHPSGKQFLKILGKHLRNREISGLQTFISTKLRNELKCGTFNQRLRRLTPAERMYIKGSYMLGVTEFEMPPHDPSLAEAGSSEEDVPSIPEETKGSGAFSKPCQVSYQALSISKKKVSCSESPLDGQSGSSFTPLKTSTPTLNDDKISKFLTKPCAIRVQVEDILKNENMLQKMVKDICEGFFSEKKEEMAQCSSSAKVTSAQHDQSDSGIEKSDVVPPDTATLYEESLSDSVLGHISDMVENSATGSLTDAKESTQANERDTETEARGDSSDEEGVLDARVSTITLIEVFRKHSAKKKGLNFKAFPTKKGYKLAAKGLQNWSLTAAAGAPAPDDTVVTHLLSEVSKFDICNEAEKTAISVDQLKVTEGKKLATRLGQLTLSCDKKIPALLVVRDDGDFS